MRSLNRWPAYSFLICTASRLNSSGFYLLITVAIDLLVSSVGS
jgi:hypothetical protein